MKLMDKLAFSNLEFFIRGETLAGELDISKLGLINKNDENRLSLSQKLAKGLEQIIAKKDFQKKIFLLDVSGSMENYVDDNSKLDHLRNIMKDYPEARKVCFSSDVYCNIDRDGNLDCDIPQFASGTTDLARAIRYLRTMKRPERIVLISDGEPDDQYSAMHEAVQFSVPIDIIFIGKKGSSGERFMINLAKNTNGKEFTIEDKSNVNFQKQLSVKIAGLLTSGSEKI